MTELIYCDPCQIYDGKREYAMRRELIAISSRSGIAVAFCDKHWQLFVAPLRELLTDVLSYIDDHETDR